MKKLFTLFGIALCFFLLGNQSSNAQISISVTGNTNTTPNLAVSYASLSAAITALNTVTAMSGPVVFNLAAGGTETLVNQVITTTASSVANTITFQKSGLGANPLLTAGTGVGTYDGVIEIQGTDYIIFDGINIQENAANTTTTTQMEWGYGVFASSTTNASQYVTIKNCTITLNKVNTGSNGIYARTYSATGTSYTPASVAGVISYCKFYNNTIQNCYAGITLYGSSSTYPFLANEIGTELGGTNTITNIGGSSSNVYGIHLRYQSEVKVFNTTMTSLTSSSTIYGVYTYYLYGTNDFYNNTFSSFTATGGTLYGFYLYLSSTSNNNIYSNTFTGMSNTAGNVYGINVATGTTNNVYKNRIYDITYSGSSTYIAYGLSISGGTTNNVYNNYISDIKAPASTGTPGVRAVNLSSGTIRFYYNSIYVGYTSTTATNQSSAIYLTITPTVDMRNNIVVNNTNVTTGLYAVALYKSTTDLSNIAATTNYNLYYAGTPSAKNLIFYDMTNSDQTLASYKTRLNPREANSISELPPFTNIATTPYNLHLTAGTPTQCESGGQRITSPIAITDDYDADLRFGETGYSGTGTAPDIGADEGEFTPAQVMNYVSSTTTQVTGYAYVGALNQHIIRIEVVTSGATNPLTVSQFDVNANGTTNILDINGSTAKIYYTGTSSTFGTSVLFGSLTPTIANFSVAGSQALSEGTNYFWLAYDISTGATSGNFIDGECVSVIVDGNPQTPDVTAPAGNKTIIGPMSGTYYVGQGQSFPNFVTITDAISNLNNRGVSGAVTLVLTNSSGTPYNTANGETFPLTLSTATGMSATNTVTIKPNTGVTPIISDASTTSIFKFNQGDYFIIDGSNSGGTDRSLTIENTSTATNTTPVWLSSGASAGTGATYNTVKNCNLKAGLNTVSTTFGVFLGGTTIGTGVYGFDNDYNTIQNNYIYKAYYGIYSNGSATATSNNISITGNTIGAPIGVNTDYIWYIGIYLLQSPDVTVAQNTIQNIITSVSTPKGLYIGAGVTNSTFSRNNINNITYTGATGYGGWGINVVGTSATSNLTFDNNIIYIMGGDGWTTFAGSSMVGMFFDGTIGGLNIYHNSVYMSGTFTRASATLTTAILLNTSTITNIDLRNNIFQNSLNNTTGVGAKNYAIYSTAPNTSFTQINYNDYWVTGTQGILGYLGADQTTIAAWRTATGKDGNSFNVDPQYNGTTDLRPSISSPMLAAGTPVGILVDYLGAPRSGTNPTIGAYENGVDAAPPVITYTALGNTTSTANRTLDNVTITDVGAGVDWSNLPRIYYKKSTDNNVFGGNTSGDNGWKWTVANVSSSPTNFTIDYSIIFGGIVSVDDIIQYFVVAQDLFTTPNVGANPSAGFVGTSVSSITSAPTTPNQYKIVAAPMSGDYTVGILMFNKLTGHNLIIEKRVRKVMREVTYEEEVTDIVKTQEKTKENSKTNLNNDVAEEITTPTKMTVTKTRMIEVEEEYGILMENGKEFKGDLQDGYDRGVYPTITLAIAAAVERGVSGPVRFLLNDATYSDETYPIVIPEITGANATNTITLKPNLGVTSVVTATAPATAMFHLNGADYIIFDGSNTLGGTSRDMTFQNNSTSVPIFRMENGATNNTIKNCNLEGAITTTTSGVIALLSTTSVGNSYNTINNNKISDRTGTGAPYNAIYSLGLASAPNSNNTISGNELTNFTNNGIYVTATGNGSNWTISGNHFYNSLTPAVAQTSINFIPGAPSKSNTVTGNVIGGSAYNAGGTAWTNSGAVTFTGIIMAVDSVDGSTITNNTVKNISLTSTGAAAFNGINVTLGFVNVTGNTIGDESTANSILNAGSSTTHGIQMLHATGTYNMYSILTRQDVKDNLIANLSSTGTGTSVRVRGVHFASYARLNISRNNIHHLYTLGTGTGVGGNTQDAVGINGWQQTYQGIIIDSNTVHTITAANTGALATSACGIFTSNFDGTFSRNRIYNIINNSTGTTLTTPPIAAGIFMRWSNNGVICNNMITIGNGLTDNVQCDGIIQVSNYASANYTLFVYYNTITIQGTATSGTHRCYGFVIGDNTGTTAILTAPTIRNNIFDNQRTGGTGLYYAIGYQVLSTGWTASSSDYNILNSTSASTVGYWNNVDQTFAGWKTASGGDGNSSTGQTVTYVNSATGDLHLNMGLTPTPIESGGTVITGLTVDIDNDTRPGPTGSVNGGAFAPDLGADEFDGVFKDIMPPVISYTLIPNQTGTIGMSFTNVTITDRTGVNTDPNTKPRCYYKRSTDANTWNDNTSGSDGWKYAEANGTESPFDFNIDYSILNGGTGVSLGTVVQYFVVAQDLVVPPNVGINSGTFAATPSSVDLTIAAFPIGGTINSYTIVGAPMTGTYRVGTNPFNQKTGKNLYYMIEKVKVTIPVLVEDNAAVEDFGIVNKKVNSKFDLKSKTSATEKTKAELKRDYRTEYREVEQEIRVLYENGKPYKGSLRTVDFYNANSKSKNSFDGQERGDYATITAAITDLNSRGVSGPVTFVLVDAAYSEAGTVTISNVTGVSATNTITIKPDIGISPTISGNLATPIFDLSGCQYVTIDGSNNGTTTKDLTISNTNTSGPALRLINDASNNTIKNTILNSVITTTTSGVVLFSTTTGTTGCDNNTLTNCTITAGATSPANGIYLLGTTGFNGDNNNITNNIITNFSAYGINLNNYYNATNISGNEIYEATAQTSTSIIGIYVNYGMLTTNITNNKIHDLNTSGAAPTLKGIMYDNGTSGDILNISNNVIYLDASTTNQGTIYGIDNYANAGTIGNIRYNSIYIGGSDITVSVNTACIYDRFGHTSDFLNNIFYNARSNSTGTGKHYALYKTTSILTSNYNNVYVTGTGGILFYNSADVLTLAAWRTATNNDAYSISGDPGFTSTSNLQPNVNNPLCWNINGKGMPTNLVTTDINGVARSQLVTTGATDIGAYEFTPAVDPNDATQTGTIGDGNTTTYTVAGNTVVSITWHQGAGTLPSSISVKYRSGENPSGTPPSSNFGNLNTVITPTGGSGFTYDMIYYYTPALIGTITNETNLRFAKYDISTGWVQWDVLPNNTNKTVSVTNLNSFSTFSFGDNNSPLPVELKSFTSSVSGRDVKLTWTTQKEMNNKGFEIQRTKHSENNFANVGFVNSKGNSNSSTSYTFDDKKLNSGKYDYRLKLIDLNGNYTYYTLNNIVDISLPKQFNLSQNYPNPFNPATKIDFELPFDSRVRIVIYDMLGREVKTLVNGETRQAGFYTININASELSSGTYFYRMIANSQSKDNIFTKKMVIVK